MAKAQPSARREQAAGELACMLSVCLVAINALYAGRHLEQPQVPVGAHKHAGHHYFLSFNLHKLMHLPRTRRVPRTAAWPGEATHRS